MNRLCKLIIVGVLFVGAMVSTRLSFALVDCEWCVYDCMKAHNNIIYCELRCDSLCS